ncbi:A24 family peptidase [Hydrogenophaga sp. 5NK40-0174]|uniref:prepilin peptidase n=1 Tax=Hydrogenophaga sp. 5NK40-0174 TaxID=3127649 RepID=UPI00310B280F
MLFAGEPLSALFLGVLGLLVGSFLNVVIHRLPLMMERRWKEECEQFQAEANGEAAGSSLASAEEKLAEAAEQQTFNLVVPRSRCPHCGHQIRWFENIPVFSWLALGRKCSGCKAPISARYPSIEVLTGLLFAFCGWQWGLGYEALAWCGFSAAIVSLTFIDWDTTLLPDDITLPLLWAGVCLAALGITEVGLAASVWGAVVGYLSLWSIYWLFKLTTGKEGMGFGDFKLFAALGAWFGLASLLPIILIASIVGSVIGIAFKLSSNLREGGYIPFGPFLALGGLGVMLLGSATMLGWLGLSVT